MPVKRPSMLETTALGAAIAAGLAIGLWKDVSELKNVNTTGATTFRPDMEEKERKRLFGRWEKAVGMSKGWEGE